MTTEKIDLSHLPEAQVEKLRSCGIPDEAIARYSPWGVVKAPRREPRALPPLSDEEDAKRKAQADKIANELLWSH